MRDNTQSTAAVGFTIKSGWASAVLVIGRPSSPQVADSRRIELSDPTVPSSRQPYHAGFGTARDAGPRLTRLVTSVERYGRQSVIDLIEQYRADGHVVGAAAIVAGSLIDPARLTNAHIRIHALEGQLFRTVVHDAVAQAGLPCSIWRERDLHASAAKAMRKNDETVRTTLASIGRSVAGPWRAEQKAAALAAWMVLTETAAHRT